ncbi:hypothetical protein QQP08_005119 [Theobroma cacao]|nr:hypothetical protein QQP08_005119 [Theobroma cacao]
MSLPSRSATSDYTDDLSSRGAAVGDGCTTTMLDCIDAAIIAPATGMSEDGFWVQHNQYAAQCPQTNQAPLRDNDIRKDLYRNN